MGWSFNSIDHGRERHIAELTSQDFFATGYTLIKSRVVGNHIWSAVRNDATGAVFVNLTLIAKERGGGWGHKSMSESAGPYYHDCPMSILALCTAPVGKYASEWRERVHKYHAAKQSRPKLKAGDLVTYGEHTYRLDAPAGPRRGWAVTRLDGARCRMKAHQIAKAVLA